MCPICGPTHTHTCITTLLKHTTGIQPALSYLLQQDLPEDYVCPICGAGKSKFESRVKVVAGFAENQQYGLGTNSMTGGQKLLIIYGSLLAFVMLFLLGYALD